MQTLTADTIDLFALQGMAAHPLVAGVAQRQATLLAKQRHALEELTTAVAAMREAEAEEAQRMGAGAQRWTASAGLRKARTRVEEVQDEIDLLHQALVAVNAERETAEIEAQAILGPVLRREVHARLTALVAAMEEVLAAQAALAELMTQGQRLGMSVPGYQWLDATLPARITAMQRQQTAFAAAYTT